ncbi:T-cell receptor gamma chain C region C10.5 [Oncorhynchus mykiss]|uniref:T-cell receptor gamma chain C region C10.5 n=1 Tax=Oncorhynchus mykiss TaxID=8022 RepID=UPI001877C95A|nr:T-cell receptor gamma chain C region C10.5 [Oncorhynchus mykiss]
MATESPTEAGKWENGSAVGGELQVDREFNETFGKKGLHFVHLKSEAYYRRSMRYACWFANQRLEFGSGTTLYVTDGIQRKPKVTLYSASNSESNGKTTLLCLARDMFPDLVKISWKMEDANGGRTEVPKAEGEQLEQREEEQTTSMIIIDKDNTYRNKYICSVEHEWGAQHLVIPKDTPTTMSAPAFRNDTQESLTLQFTEDSFQSTCSLNLASVVYTVMIVKSMVYCCGLSLLLHNRILGRGPSTRRPL